MDIEPRRAQPAGDGPSPQMMYDDLVQRCRMGPKTLRELDNRINLQWYLGQPYWRRLPMTNRVLQVAPDKRQNFIYVNLVFDIVRTLTGAMYYDPSVEASPQTIDPEDSARARATQFIGNAIIKNTSFGDKYKRALDMCHLYGHAWIKCFWDPSQGQRTPIVHTKKCPQCTQPPLGMAPGTVFDPQTGTPAPCPTCNTQGIVYDPNGPLPSSFGVVSEYTFAEPEGDVNYVVVHPDDIYIDPDANDIDSAEEIIHIMRMSPEQAWRMYGKRLDIPLEKFKEAPKPDTSINYSTNLAYLLERPTTLRAISVSEYYRRPNDEHPEGVFGIFLGDTEIFSGPLPYMHDTHPFPFFPLCMYETTGMLYPMATIDLVLPLIVALNDHLSAQHARARQSARLRWKIPDASSAKVDDLTGNMLYKDRPGRPGPEPLQLSPFPSDATNIREVLLEFIDRMAGTSEIMRGKSPDSDSAKALTFLEERSLGPLKPIMAAMSRKLDDALKYGIDIARLMYNDGRVIRLLGESGQIESQEFRVENVGEATDVRLATVRDIGRSRASKMQELNEAAQNSMITADEYRELAEFGRMGALYDKRKPHEDMATYESRVLQQTGQMPPPLKRQDHDIHNDVHTKDLTAITMKGDMNSPLIAALQAHMDGHDALKAQMAVEQQLLQQQAMQQFGQANAANPATQPQAAQDAVQAQAPAGQSQPAMPAPAEPYSAQMGAPGTSPEYQQAVAQAAAIQPGVPNVP